MLPGFLALLAWLMVALAALEWRSRRLEVAR
jgi:hypothetical protein